jgi:hypothetical protein
VVSSVAYRFVGALNLSDVRDVKPGDGTRLRDLLGAARRYGRNKRVDLLFVMELQLGFRLGARD